MANNDVKCMVSDRSCSLYIIGKNERNKCGLCSVNSKEKERVDLWTILTLDNN